MDRTDNGSVTVDELALIIGAQRIELHVLQKHIQALQKRIAELEPKPTEQ